MLTIAKLLKVPPGLIQNPEGPFDLLIGLVSSDLLLREVYTVDGAPVHKSFFTKDLMLASSPVASLLSIKGRWAARGSGQKTLSSIPTASRPIC